MSINVINVTRQTRSRYLKGKSISYRLTWVQGVRIFQFETDLILWENHCRYGELPRNITHTFSQSHWLFILLKLYLETLHEWNRKQVTRTGYLVFNWTLLLALHIKQANTSWLREWDLTRGVAYAHVDWTGVRFCFIHLSLDLSWCTYFWIWIDTPKSGYGMIHLFLYFAWYT